MTDSLLKESPLLVALNKEKTVYDGFISVQVGARALASAKNKLVQVCCFPVTMVTPNKVYSL